MGIRGKRRTTITTTDEEVKILGPLEVRQLGGRVRNVNIRIRESDYTQLVEECQRLNQRAQESNIELKREVTPASLVEVLVYWYVTTRGDVDLLGKLGS